MDQPKRDLPERFKPPLAVRLTEPDKAALAALTQHLQKTGQANSRNAAVRWAIQHAAKAFELTEQGAGAAA